MKKVYHNISRKLGPYKKQNGTVSYNEKLIRDSGFFDPGVMRSSGSNKPMGKSAFLKRLNILRNNHS
ncbi:MAG: hypothetical protein COB76_01000 [Alphaproteobacteria bacterium]|nr:MAG: hypothetical protein COB76_01000 [Alphaproteobacteria bacterium]